MWATPDLLCNLNAQHWHVGMRGQQFVFQYFNPGKIQQIPVHGLGLSLLNYIVHVQFNGINLFLFQIGNDQKLSTNCKGCSIKMCFQ